jgi:methionine-S-sulfoxide reductase
VGYTGGSTASPTYRSLGDHTEALQVEYDPEAISYDDLLAVFWADHDPGQSQWSRQYRTAVFAHNEEQRRLALASRDLVAASRGREVTTAVEALGTFYPAEDYHQKYYLRRNSALAREYAAIYPRTEDFVGSTAVARVNGFLGGNGTMEDLEAQLARLGLSSRGKGRLREYVETISPRRECPVPGRGKRKGAPGEAAPKPSPVR